MAGRLHSLSATEPADARRPIVWLIPIFLFVISLLPRLVALERYITPDELVWVYRSLQFRQALLDGHWAGTLVAGHPGVTTTWLGALSLSAQLLVAPDSRAAYDWLARTAALTPDNVEAFRRLAVFLSGGRIAVALVNSLGVVAAYGMARRLWPARAALLAGVLLALDPFLVGLSGLFHVDGLSATFATLSLLALAVALGGRGRRVAWLAAAGASAALAALSKTPTLVLLPVTGLALLWPLATNRDATWRSRVGRLLRDGLVWGAAFAIVLILLFPALWAGPAAVVAVVGGSANRHIDEALRPTFFLGRVAFDHGPLFYPVVLLWRLSPVVWLAAVPALWLFIRHRPAGWWRAAAWLAAALLVVWAALFLVAITPAAKKFDRYILPVVPSLLIVAGVAWAGWAARSKRWGRAVWFVPVAQAIFWLAHAAYPLAAYNPLAGGSWTARLVLPAGWGEGIGAAGRWLAQTQPDAVARVAIAGVAPSLAPFFPGRTLVDGLDDPAAADFQIATLGGRQLDPDGAAAQVAGLELVHTVRFGGLEQAWVYRRAAPLPIAPPPAQEPPVGFGDRFELTAFEQSVNDGIVNLAARWRRLAALSPEQRYTLRLAVADDAGNVWAAQEMDLLNETAFYPPDWPTDETGTVRYALELPAAMPPGRYQLQGSLVDEATAGQLPVRVGDTSAGVLYTLTDIEVPLPEQIVSASRVQIPQTSGARWLDGSLWLLGHSDLPDAALAGGDLALDLFWHLPAGTLPAGLQLAWSLQPLDGDAQSLAVGDTPTPLSRFDTGQWRTGETIQEKYRLPIPPPTPAGRYRLLVQPLDATGQPAGEPLALGELQIDNIDRLYDVPMDVARPLLDVCFGETICLRGATLSTITAAPGDEVELVLYWQALDEPAAVYTVFLHVLNEAGETVLAADHWPGGLPSDIWDAGQVITDRVPLALPPDLPPGDYRLRLGLYTADDGHRLPIDATNGEAAADHLILPLTLTVGQP